MTKDKEKKITWRYQLMKYKEGTIGVHEIYDNGKYWTTEPIIIGDSLEDILETLKMIENDIVNHSILKYK